MMIIEKLLDQSQLTDTEKHIADYLLNKDNQIENLSSIELGQKSFTSQSAVMRLSKKMGMKTYREFLSALILERNEYLKVGDVYDGELSQYFSSYEDIQTTISRLYAHTMIYTNLLLDKNTVIRVCNRLMNAYSIDVYGIGISETIAKQMSFQLQSIGLNCSCHDGLNHYYVENMKDKKRNVSILITLTGINETIVNIARKLKEQKIYTVLILAKEENELMHICQDFLLFDANKHKDIDMMCSSFAAKYIVNIIYSILIARKQCVHSTSCSNL